MTLQEQIAELERENRVRRKVFPGWIQQGRLSAQAAEHRIACFDATIAQLKKLQGFEEVSKAAWKQGEMI